MTPTDGDEHHTLDELYTYRMLYNAHAANLWAEHGTYPVMKSWRHYDGEACFGGGWFIVTATLPDGQVSNHYPAADWDRFRVPEVPTAPEWDGHTPAVAAERLRAALDAPLAPADPLAHIRTGDEDPTADLAGDDCPAVWARGWGCTRDLGHPGQHIAGDGAIVCATLPAGGAW